MHKKFSLRRWLTMVVTATFAIVGSIVAIDAPARAASVGSTSTVDYTGVFASANQQFFSGTFDIDQAAQSFTAEAWVRDTSSAAGMRVIFAQGSEGAATNRFALGTTTGDDSSRREVAWAYRSSSTTGTTSGSGVYIPINEWTHLALVATATNVKIYVNAQLAKTVTNGDTADISGTFHIGRGAYAPELFWQGDIDEVRVWSGDQSASIAARMHQYVASNTSGLRAYFDFNEGSGTSVYNRVTDAGLTASASTPTFSTIEETSKVEGKTVVKFPRSYLTPAGGWTVPAGVTRADLFAVAGGGGGGGGGFGGVGYVGGGGGGGAGGEAELISGGALTPAAVLDIEVGQGGLGGLGGQSNSWQGEAGRSGQNTLVGSLISAQRGFGGWGAGLNDGTLLTGRSASGWLGIPETSGSNNPQYQDQNGGQGGQSVTFSGGQGYGSATGIPGAGGGGAGTSGAGSSASSASAAGSGGAGYSYRSTSYGAGASGGIANSGASVSYPQLNSGNGGQGGNGSTSSGTSVAGAPGAPGVVIISYAPTEDTYLLLDGTSQYAAASSAQILPATGDFTVEAWVNPADSSPAYAMILSQGSNVNKFYVKRSGSKLIVARGTANEIDCGNLPEASWSHVAVSMAGSTLRCFVNGRLITMQTGYDTTSVSTGFYVGQFSLNPSSVAEYWKGAIDQVKVWNTGISDQTTISRSMHMHGATDATGTVTGLVHLFDFNDSLVSGESNRVTDLNLTFTGTPQRNSVVSTYSNAGNKVYKFTRSVLTAWGGWIAPAGLASNVKALAVAGGGSGGTRHAAGGGAGELFYSNSWMAHSNEVIPVIVGQGAPSAKRTQETNVAVAPGLNGQDTKLGNLTLKGGGGGGLQGGSSGGNWDSRIAASPNNPVNLYNASTNPSGTIFANAGGMGGYNSNFWGNGGGGGAMGSGSDAQVSTFGNGSPGPGGASAGAGGEGFGSNIDGAAKCYGAGGGGGIAGTGTLGVAGQCLAGAFTIAAASTAGAGGNSTNSTTIDGGNAVANSGSGGGGGGQTSAMLNGIGGAGGSGVVVISASLQTAAPSVSGAHKFNETLTANGATYSGVTVSSTTYKWQRADTQNGTYSDIAGATAATYKLVCADLRKYVRLASTANFSDSTSATSFSSGTLVTSKVVQNGLIMHFDSECPGSTSGQWGDQSGNSNNMTLSGTMRQTADGAWHQFDGIDDYGYLGTKTFNFSNGFTATFYANFGNKQNWERIFDFGDSDANKNVWIGRVDGTAHLGIEIFLAGVGTSVGRCVAENAITDNTWSHFAVVINTNNSCAIYKNGVAQTLSTNQSYTLKPASDFRLPTSVSRNNTYFGKSNWADPYFEGGIGDFAMYGSALSNGDVTANYNAQRYVSALALGSASISYPNSNAASYSADATLSPTVSADSSGTKTYSTSSASTICTVNSSTGVITIKGVGDCTVTMAVAADSTYDATSASRTVVISKGAQATLTVNASASMNYLATQTLTTSGGSGTGAVTFSKDSGTCTLSGAVITATQAGSCVVKATKTGDANYLVAESATFTITINKISQAALNITSATSMTFGQTLTLNAAGGSGPQVISYALVTPGVCSISGTAPFVLSASGAGSCVVKATNAASTNYNAVESANVTITVNKASRTATFTSTVPATPVAGGTYSVTGSLSAGGGSPAFAIAAASSSVCSISGSTVTFDASGSCVIEASKPEDANYLAAATVTQTIAVGSRNQTITFGNITDKTFGDQAFALAATASSTLNVTYSEGATTNDACDVSSAGLVTVKNLGTCVIRANQPGNATWAAASQVVRTFEVLADLPGVPFITSVSAGNQSMTASFYAPSYTGGDALAAYELVAQAAAPSLSVSNSACSIAANGAGVITCTVTGLTNGTSYQLKVAAINSAGRGEFTALSAAQTAVSAPEAVGSFTAVADNTALNLVWTTPATFGGGTWDSYRVYVRPAGGSYPAANAPTLVIDGSNGSSTTVAWQLTGLVNGTAYDVKIVTITTANNQSLESNTAEVSQTPRTVPAAPPVVSALEVGSDLVITWTPPTNDGGSAISAYVVAVDGTPCTVSGTTCVVPAPTAPGNYDIEVKARNSAGDSPAATTTFTRASAPAGNGGNGNGTSGNGTSGNGGLTNPNGLGVQIGTNAPKAIGIDKKTLVHVDAGKVTITGENLAEVTEIKIGGRIAKIISKSDGELVIEMPKQKIGAHDVEISNPTGATIIEDALQAVKGKYTLLRTRVVAEPTKEVSAGEKVLVAQRIEIAKYATVITCAGRVAKAKEICDFAKSVNPDLQTRILPRLWVGDDAYLVRTVLWN